VAAITNTQASPSRHLRALSYTPVHRSTGPPLARCLAVIDYSILSILSSVDIGRRARVLDVIVTSYPVSARRTTLPPVLHFPYVQYRAAMHDKCFYISQNNANFACTVNNKIEFGAKTENTRGWTLTHAGHSIAFNMFLYFVACDLDL